MAFDFDTILDRRNTGSLKWDAAGRFYGLDDVIPLWVADMDFPAPPAVVDAVRRRAEHPAYGYPLAAADHWDPIIRWLAARQDWTVQRDWLVRCPGVVPAVNLCVLAYTAPGDKIVLQTPAYHPFYTAVENNGRRLVRNPLRFEEGRWTMDLEDLGRKIDGRTRMLILCSPHNPVGRVWRSVELERLARLCAERDVIVIADEIHADLVFRGHRQTPFASLGAEAARRTVTLQAPSKTFNTAGLTTAFAVIPDDRIRALFLTQVQNLGLTVGNVFGFAAMEAAYADGAAWLDELLGYLEGSLDMVETFVRDRLSELRFHRPEGTYLALIDARGLGLPSAAVFKFILEKARVYLDDGAKFGPEASGFLRMNVASPRSILRQALERIERAVRDR